MIGAVPSFGDHAIPFDMNGSGATCGKGVLVYVDGDELSLDDELGVFGGSIVPPLLVGDGLRLIIVAGVVGLKGGVGYGWR